MAKIRPSVWAEDVSGVKRNKQKQVSTRCISDRLVSCTLIPHLVLEDILHLIVSRMSPDVFIDRQTNAEYKPDFDLDYVRHMYHKFSYVYVIHLCRTMVDFCMP